MLQFTQVIKTYQGRTILQIPELTIRSGTYWLQGGNGSGKTTLMKMIAGINPFDGDITLFNLNIHSQPVAYRKLISFAEAAPQFPSFLTGWDLIRFVQNTRQETNDHIQQLIDHFDIQSFLSYAIGTYSSGMLKKLSILLAFIGQTKFILLDEPLITLEDSSLPVLFSLIKERQALGVSFLISSHQAFATDQFQTTGKIVVANHTISLG